jgi:hypothetical protein
MLSQLLIIPNDINTFVNNTSQFFTSGLYYKSDYYTLIVSEINVLHSTFIRS